MAEVFKERFKFSFESSASASYLVVGADISANMQAYQVEMLAGNEIQGILPLDVRHKDDVVSLYYNITSRLALSQFLKRKKLKRDEFINILAGMVKTLLDCKNYFLSDKCFLLDEEYIYINPNTLDVSMVYIPIPMEMDTNQNFKDFTIRLIMYTANIDDEGSDNFLQKILGFLKNEAFNTAEFDKLLKSLKSPATAPVNSFMETPPAMQEAPVPAVEAPREIVTPPQRERAIPFKEAKPVAEPRKPEVQRPERPVSIPGRPEAVRPQTRKPEKPAPEGRPAAMKEVTKTHYKSTVLITAAIIQGAIAIVLLAVFASGVLKLLGGDMVSTSLGVVLVAGAGSALLWKNSLDKKNLITETVSVRDDGARGRKPVNMDKREMRNVPVVPQNAVPQAEMKPLAAPLQEAYQMPFYGNATEAPLLSRINETVVLGYSNVRYPYLQARKDGVLEEIKINKPSFIIGRLREQVDYISQNNTVGKVHAEIATREGCCYVKDLNSRNGTYINGERIESNKEYPIKDNDKVAFSNSEFTFRMPL